jgi:transporter family-2 protein
VTQAWVLLAVVMGAFLAVQPTLNAEIGRHVGGSVPAAFVNFGTGFLTLIVFMLVLRTSVPELSAARAAPWWAWLGGVIGAVFVVTGAFLTPRIGVTALIAGILVGQLAASLLLDHFGAFNLDVREASWSRVLGVLLAAAGVWFVSRS